MGTVKKWSVQIPALSGDFKRRIFVYLPDSYNTEPERRYPVMYMFDGHNVFFDEDATYGKSWGMLEYMNRSQMDLIIVAVECNHQGYCRLEEYSPVDFEFPPCGKIKGRGAEYMEWLTSTLKPYIDTHIRTVPDRSNTLICGSSMGGLMALYAITQYNHIFSRAACLSPSLWVNAISILELLEKADISHDSYVYMDYGSEEMRDRENMNEILLSVAELFLKKGIQTLYRVVSGGTHSESSWEKQIPIFMDYLSV